MNPANETETLSALQAFRARNINASNKNAALKSTMPQLDLSHYKSILKNASAVEAAEKALSTFKPVDYDVSKWDKVVDAFEQKAVSQAKETVQKVDKEETDLKATLSNITEARPFEDLTSDEAAAANPEISKATEVSHNVAVQGRWRSEMSSTSPDFFHVSSAFPERCIANAFAGYD